MECNSLDVEKHNKNVLIIGGSGGIGQGIAEALNNNGYSVYATYNTQIPNSPYVANWIKCDLLDDKFDVNEIEASIDFIVVASGVESPDMLSSVSASNLIDIMKITCYTPLTIIQKMLQMQEHLKKIVFISSDAGTNCRFKTGLYAYAKACLNNMVYILSNELIDRKITVNAIAPGWCNTDMTRRVLTNREMTIEDIAITKIDGKIIQPIEVGRAVLYLLNDSSIHINGQIIEISSPSIK